MQSANLHEPVAYLPALKKNSVLSKSKFKCLWENRTHMYVRYLTCLLKIHDINGNNHIQMFKPEHFNCFKLGMQYIFYYQFSHTNTYPWKCPRTKLQIFSFEMACRFWNSCRALNRIKTHNPLIAVYQSSQLFDIVSILPIKEISCEQKMWTS